MRPPEGVKRGFVVQWIRSADGDLAAAKHLLSGGTELVPGAVFHAQQAVEKCLKAVLVWYQVEFPKTHDIGRLMDLLKTVDSGLADRVREASALTPYAVEARYPSDLPEPTLAEAREALSIATRVRDAVLRQLAPVLGPDKRQE
jgi:HEPN domain-containing protein